MAVEVTPAVVREPTDIETTVSEFAREPNGGLIVIPDTFTIIHRELIVGLANQNRLPAIYPYLGLGRAGALATYGFSAIEIYGRAAEYIDRILKGANPSDLPVQEPTKFELGFNLKTAKALDLAIPTSLLALADEVIE
jgi:putative ABC transport system substrate-binding protein